MRAEKRSRRPKPAPASDDAGRLLAALLASIAADPEAGGWAEWAAALLTDAGDQTTADRPAPKTTTARRP